MNAKKIFVAVDLRSPRFFDNSLNTLAGARKLADAVSGSVTALILDSGQACGELTPDEAAGRVVLFGADRALLVRDPALSPLRPDVAAEAVIRTVEQEAPGLVLFPLSDLFREAAARSAARLQAGLIAECAGLEMADGRVAALCPSWGGRVVARNVFAQGQSVGFVTVLPTAFTRQEDPDRTGSVETLDLGPLPFAEGLEFVSAEPEEPDARSLEQAETVVVGGAGAGGTEGFSLLRELAATLGGELGATRPPVLAHLVDEERLIGQTGKSVRPRLLLSIGASGAVQFTAGIAGSETVVAVNRDPAAPIFSLADIGIVADAREFIPAFLETAQASAMRRLAQNACASGENGAQATLGAAVAKLRGSRGWSHEDLARETGQSPEFVEKVENDQVSPSVAFILRLAKALGVDPGNFLGREEKAQIRDRRAKAYQQRTDNYSYQNLTPEAENEHLRAFLINIEARKAHKPVAYKHEGEEFVFVLEGELQLTLGGKSVKLTPGESKRFNSEIPHKLKSLSETETRCLVVLYTPEETKA